SKPHAEPWMAEAEAWRLRRDCLTYIDRGRRAAVAPLVADADAVTAGLLLSALIARGGPLPAADFKRVAAGGRPPTRLFAALEQAHRAREMPSEWATEDALVDAEALDHVARSYGQVPDAFVHLVTDVVYEKRPARIVYVQITAKGEYAKVPPVTVAVGP